MIGQDRIGRPNRSASEVNADAHVIINDAEGGVAGVDGVVEEYTHFLRAVSLVDSIRHDRWRMTDQQRIGVVRHQ